MNVAHHNGCYRLSCHASPLAVDHTLAVLFALLTKAGKNGADLSLQSCHFAGDPGQHAVLAQLQHLLILLQLVHPICQGCLDFKQKDFFPACMCPIAQCTANCQLLLRTADLTEQAKLHVYRGVGYAI